MRLPHRIPPPPHALSLLLSGSLLLCLWLAVSQAQVTTAITSDRTLGTAVTQQGNVYAITGGTRPNEGPNLFHSFDRFSVGTGDIASFRGPQTGITNILSRVTGGQRSDIDGTLRSEIPGANLYLLNPAGVLFGPNASLDISGSFHVSTADYLRLADGARFSARLSDTTTLSVAPPVAFGFLGPQPASLSVDQSILQVPEEQTLSMVGGDVRIVGGQLVAPGGRIQIASVASAGEVIPAPTGHAPDLQVDSFMRLGRITLSNALVDASGNGGGLVLVRGGRLLVDNTFMFADNLGPRDGAGLGMDLGITGDAVFTNGSLITADSLGTGRARDLRLTAGSVRLEQGAQIGSSTVGPGQGGTVQVTATDTLTLAGASPDGRFPSGIFASALGTEVGAGSAGSVLVTAPRVTLTEGAQIGSSTVGPGQGGTVQVTVTDTLTLAGTSPDGRFPSGIFASALGTEVGAGSAGNVLVTAPRVTLTEGAQIASRTLGSGQGGTVQVTATDTLTLVGTSPDGHAISGIAADALGTEVGAGNAGNVLVTAPRVTLTEGAQITSSTLGPGQGGTVQVIATDTLTLAGISPDGRSTSGIAAEAQGIEVGAGRGGNVVVTAPRVTLTEGAQITSRTLGSGQGGTVQVTATDTLTLTDSGISSNAEGTEVGAGNAGNVIIAAPRVSLTDGAQISSSTLGPGQGGTVQVTATDTLSFAGTTPDGIGPSGLFAPAEGTGAQAGNAGNVVVVASRVTLTAGAQISSGTFGPGQGGTVRVTATDTLTLAGTSSDGSIRSGIFATAQGTGAGAGDAGVVVVEAPALRIADGAQIASSTLGPGQGGVVTVTTADALTITGRDSGLRTTAASSGRGGDIAVDARQVQLTEGAVISAESSGSSHAGNVTIAASETFRGVHGSVSTVAKEGRGGSITIASGVLIDLTTTEASATVTGGSQPGGDIVLTTPTLTLTGGRLAAETTAAGPAGSITLNTGTVTAQEATLTSSSTGAATGNAGTVTIQGLGGAGTLPRTVTLTGSMLQTTAEGSGAGGAITVAASDGLQLDHTTLSATVANGADRLGGPRGDVTLTAPTLIIRGGRLAAETTGTRQAGAITLNVGQLTATEQATLTSSSTGTAAGDAGTVTVQGFAGAGTAAGMVTLSDSALLTQAAGEGAGGNILVRAGDVVLRDGATISATARGTGQAGEIRLSDIVTLQSTESTMTTEAAAGRGGAIAITAVTEMELTRTQVSATVTGGMQPGGDVTLTTPVLRLTGGRVEAETRGAGTAGALTLNVGQLTATEQATLTSSSTGPATGNAGTVTIQGLGGPGTLPHTVTLTGSTLQTSAEGTGAGGAITVGASDGLQLDHTTLLATVANGADLPGGSHGDVTLTAPTLTIRGGRLAAETTGTRRAGAITLNVGSLTVTEQATLSSSSTGTATGDAGTVSVQGLAGTGTAAGMVTLSDSALLTRTAGAGRGGDVVVETGILTLAEGARLDSSTQGDGSGGTVTVRADATVTLTGPRSGLFTETAGSGTGGSLVLEAGALQMQEGAQISAASTGTGKAGGIQIRARDSIQSHNSAVTTAATAGATGGDIAMTAQRFIDLHASDITASVSGGSGTGGNLTLTTPILRLEGGTLRATTASAGQGGAIAVDVGQAQLVAGARMDSSTMGTGAGGTVTITAADPVLLTGADTGVFTRSTGAGPGGDIRLTAPRVILSDGATLSAESTGPGNAGNITLTLHDSFMSTRGSVVTRATQADGGNITITAPNLVRLRDSAITAEVGGGPQTVGGNISIDPQFVLLQNSQIVANAFAGQGGTIRIQARQVFLADPASLVSASSILGIDGQVNIQAPVTSLSGTVTPLPQSFAPTAELLRDRCAARLHEGTVSSLVERGRDGVPASPEGLLPSRLTGAPPSTATPRTTGQRPRPRPAAHYQGGLQHDAAGRLQITNWPTSAASVQVQEVECGTR